MGVLIGGEKAWATRRNGEIGVSLEWMNGEPHMILFPTNGHPDKGAGAFCIPIDSAWKYVHSDGHPNYEYIASQAPIACQMMGLVESKQRVYRIAETIADNMGDLLKMPPEPVSQQEKPAPVGEMTIKLDGETVHEEEV